MCACTGHFRSPGLASPSRFPAYSGSLLLSAYSPGATPFTWSSEVSGHQRYRPERGGPRREWGTLAPLDPVFRWRAGVALARFLLTNITDTLTRNSPINLSTLCTIEHYAVRSV
ncbi:hypothetical protein L209DRAFT_759210 [Thermothelomyces heterothallicus CBS 203.75]